MTCVAAILEIKAEAEKMGCDVVEVDKGRWESVPLTVDLGLVIVCSPLSFEPLKTMPPAPQDGSQDRPPLWLVLDEVMDPQNLGALLRSAYFLGADGVIVCSKNSAGLTCVLAPCPSPTSLPDSAQADREQGERRSHGALRDPFREVSSGSPSCSCCLLLTSCSQQPDAVLELVQGAGLAGRARK
eukprot:757757-Hanusia_phi.AAC.4